MPGLIPDIPFSGFGVLICTDPSGTVAACKISKWSVDRRSGLSRFKITNNGIGVEKCKGNNRLYGIALDDIRIGQFRNILIKGVIGKLSAETWGINSEILKGKYLTTDVSGNIIVSDIITNIYCIDNNNVIIN